MHKRYDGFTIVELLIVIVIIGILASIVVVTFIGIRERSQAAAISDGLVKMDRSLKAWQAGEGFSRWPGDNPLGTDGNISLETMKTVSTSPYNTVKDYMAQIPNVSGIGTQAWFYDNDDNDCVQFGICNTGDDKSNCSADQGQLLTGVNIMIRWGISKTVVDMVNKTIDGDKNADGSENLMCGKLRMYTDGTLGNMIIYSLSYTKDVQ